MKNPITFLGWAMGKDRWGDETGVWHALVSVEVPGVGHVARAACAPRQRVSGQIEAPPAGAHLCDRIGCHGHRAA
jgi:hypothetical protein